MSDYNKLKEQVRSLNETYIRLSTQLDGLVKQEQQEIDNLRLLGVNDLDATIAATTAEVQQLSTNVEASLLGLKTVTP